MKPTVLLLLILLLCTTGFILKPGGTKWLTNKHREYKMFYTGEDKKNKKGYAKLIDNGIKYSKQFFNYPFSKKFDVYIHPNRHSLDSTWQNDWNQSTFKSECWMVASGVGTRLDILSPAQWHKEACEHTYADSRRTQQLVTHELIHVFHGQVTLSQDFSDMQGIDWFVEGLATYASGQCDSAWMERIKEALKQNEIPGTLDSFWTGKFRYGLSGSVVMYLDHHYGRSKIKELMLVSRKSELFSTLHIDEEELMESWKTFVQAH
jgi:hypothetical protein